MNPVSSAKKLVKPVPGNHTRAERNLAADLAELIKARLTCLSLVTTLFGYLFGWRGPLNYAQLTLTLVGTFLAAAGASALNEVFEADYDLLMRRTRERPIPGQRLSPETGFLIGILSAAAGVLILGTLINLLAGFLAALTIATYLFAYTPLKRITTLNTLIGAIPGALPPVIGWAAARGDAGLESWVLFAFLFLWQMPHFLAIAWLYREDYRNAGFVMLSGRDPDCRVTGRLALYYTMGLVCISLLPFALRLTSFWYVPIALLTGIAFFVTAFRFALSGSERGAKRLFIASIIYLPCTLAGLVLTRA